MPSFRSCLFYFLPKKELCSGDLKSGHLKFGLFEGWISNGLVYNWSGFSYRPNHLKTRPFKIQTFPDFRLQIFVSFLFSVACWPQERGSDVLVLSRYSVTLLPARISFSGPQLPTSRHGDVSDVTDRRGQQQEATDVSLCWSTAKNCGIHAGTAT